LDIIITTDSSAAGYAFPGLVYVSHPLDEDYMFAVDAEDIDEVDFDETVSHEVGHQWWAISVASDMSYHNFLVEGVTECMALVHIARTRGVMAANDYVKSYTAEMYLSYLSEYDDEIVDQSDAETEVYGRNAIDYGKAPLGLLAIRQEIGNDAFEFAIASYTKDHQFERTEPSDLLNAFEFASGEELDDLWYTWFESADVSPQDVNQLIEQTVFKAGDFM
jgi:aminopeptidase N